MTAAVQSARLQLLCPWGLFRQEHWGKLPSPPPGDLPDPGIELRSPALQVDSLPSEAPGKPNSARSSVQSRPPCPSTTRVYSNSCPLSQWCHPTISSSVIPFTSCIQSFPASESFPMSQFFASGGGSIGVSTLVSVLPMNVQDWFPLEWTAFIFLLSKGLSRVFSSTTVQKHQLIVTQLSL